MQSLPWSRLAVLACALGTGGAWALSLGPVRGVPVVGQPLDLTIPVLHEGETAPDCVEADVSFGDAPLGPGRVLVSIDDVQGRAVVRLRTRGAVNEPVVTLDVRLGCPSRFTRRLVLLAEGPGYRPPPARTEPAEAAAPVPAPALARPAPAPVATAAARDARPARAAASPAPAASARQRPTVAARPSAPPAPRGRLRLDPVDPTVQPEPTLRLSTAMASAEEGPPERRAAAVALWQALNASPDQWRQVADRVAALDAQVRTLQQSSQRQSTQLQALRGELEAARAQRYANPLVYGLALALLAALALAAWLALRRFRRPAGSAWWASRSSQDEGPDSLIPQLAPDTVSPRAAAPSEGRPPRSGMDVDLDLDFAVAPTDPQPLAEAAPSPAAAAPAQVEMARPEAELPMEDAVDSLRSLKAVELNDAQHEADFFVSIGEHQQAIAVLRNHIASHPETSALPWLDLLAIHHELGQRRDFEAVRAEFQAYFNAGVPAFEEFTGQDGNGLEDYPNAIVRIAALWPTQRGLNVIEESLFRRPEREGRPPFSLAAYRELLLLHQVGTEVLHGGAQPAAWEASAPPEMGGFSATSIHPLAAEMAPPAAGLDIDLADPLPPVGWPGTSPPPADGGNLLDFDLPDFDSGQYRTRKSGE